MLYIHQIFCCRRSVTKTQPLLGEVPRAFAQLGIRSGIGTSWLAGSRANREFIATTFIQFFHDSLCMFDDALWILLNTLDGLVTTSGATSDFLHHDFWHSFCLPQDQNREKEETLLLFGERDEQRPEMSGFIGYPLGSRRQKDIPLYVYIYCHELLVCVCLQPSCTCTETHSSQYAPATGSWKEFEHERRTLQVGTLAWRCKSSCANQKIEINEVTLSFELPSAKFFNYDHPGPRPYLSHSSLPLSPTMQLMRTVNIN